MRRKLAVGLFCATLCAANLLLTEALLAGQTPQCPFVGCNEELNTCQLHSSGCTCTPWPFVGPVCWAPLQ